MYLHCGAYFNADKTKSMWNQKSLLQWVRHTMALSTKRGSDDIIREMTRAKNIKDTVMVAIAEYMNFEDFLVPAPASICILGKLFCTSRNNNQVFLP